jgi:protein tyrosine phosphatase (PTP) superfamily phosphohydrolase (DUF442 family)
MSQLPAPMHVAGIRNFGWVVPNLLARGEQPPLERATFEALRELGIGSVVSLRPDREPPTASSAGRWPEYVVGEERRLAEVAGLRFAHVPVVDFSSPTPDNVAQALTALDEHVAEAPAVYVHCRAGAGRAGVIGGAWLIAHGGSGDQAAALYEAFMRHVIETRQMSADESLAMLLRVSQPHVWWALMQIAEALGSPVTRPFGLLPPERPPQADTWPRTFAEALQPWARAAGL